MAVQADSERDSWSETASRDPDPPPKRILCIDGGGILGTCPAAFLAKLEDDLDAPIGRYFDLIAGTSTGGILAIGLALGLPAKELRDLYVERGPVIFGQTGRTAATRWIQRRVAFARQFVCPKHDAKVLRRELEDVLGDRRIGDAHTRLLVPAWDPEYRSVYIFKTAHHERLKNDYKQPAIEAAMATAMAPTYFARHRTADNVGLLDGGVWANNPIALAVVEAITMLGWPARSLRILSLGCGDEVYRLPEAPGFIGLGFDAVKLFMSGQSRGALGMAKLLTGDQYERKAIFRYSPTMSKGDFGMDDTSQIGRLRGMGAAAARHAQPELEPIFFAAPTAKFLPCHQLEKPR
ncbi:patatin [Acuticoccus sediminis]|uniref:Patatin n=1 Tax=Acuticoccus sediminis TaxID=2184697 RepID=A0A8B2NNU2_9HYPH|nr:CBASS cGAMP-activated phospholipase [Acuticoccus sediminis]RAH96249.1 patatin [Acuticoccus sediminis]